MRVSLSIISAFVLVSKAVADETIGLCCLCDSCGPPVSGRATLAVDSSGTTCQQMVINMADTSGGARPGNALCLQLKSKWYDHCCNPNHTPTAIAQTAPVSEGANYPSGSYAPCDLCLNGQYPSLDQTLVAVLNYPDVNTCKELYWWTKQGNFEERMCAPIQNYFEGPCGCNASSSSGSSSGSSSSGGYTNTGSGTSSGSSASTGGGAPDSNYVSSNQGSTSSNPDKKVVPEESKDTDKLYAEPDRGTLRRRLKGDE